MATRPSESKRALVIGAHPDDDDGTGSAASSAPTSIHDLVVSKQEGLADHLQYDGYERRSGLVRLLPIGSAPDRWSAGGVDDLVPAVNGPWTVTAMTPRSACTTTSRPLDFATPTSAATSVGPQ